MSRELDRALAAPESTSRLVRRLFATDDVPVLGGLMAIHHGVH